ncbi:hypothetical protein ACSLBF_14935 [Pseudoalteromonas sp. T1lg65]|uniref:hypothetical protein n=1 Tax=Pseudoalteromonas sp. T1lg65 TaxID=2077101 RepID=UPI003F7B094E
MTLLLNITMLAILFPWVSFGLLDVDTQPWFILFSSVFFVFNLNKKLHFVILFPLLLFFFSVLVGLYYGFIDFLFVRAVLGSYSFFVVFAFFYLVKRFYVLPIKVVLFSNALWLLAGAIQSIWGKGVLSFLVTVRTTEDRGVTGLAPEPTYFAIFLFFLSWVLFLEKNNINDKVYKALMVLNFLFIVFVAKSTMVILFFAVLFMLYFSFYILNLRVLLGLFVCLTFTVVALPYVAILLDGTRVQGLLNFALTEPESLIRLDASINERLSHLYFSFKGFFNDYGFPHGFHQFGSELLEGRSLSNGVFWWGNNDNKIMSGTGALLYELGWLSLPFFITVGYMSVSRDCFKESMLFLLLFLILFSSAIPLSFSLLPMVLVLLFFYFNGELSNEFASHN